MNTLNPLDLLIGRQMFVDTDMKVQVLLTIESVTQEHHSQDIGPSTRENDWWPDTKEWDTYLVKFTNGATKEFSSISQIKIQI